MGEHRLVVEQAWRMFDAGERDRAYRVAQEVLALDPFDYRASELRLAQLIEHGAYAEARRLCLQLQTANPVSGWLWERRCEIARGLERPEELREAGAAWLRSEPEDPLAAAALAEGQLAVGEAAEAGQTLRTAVEQHADDRALWVQYGDWHVAHGDHPGAREAYARAYELADEPEIPEARAMDLTHLTTTSKTLYVVTLVALFIAVASWWAIGGLWGSAVVIALVGGSLHAHWHAWDVAAETIPDATRRAFLSEHPLLVRAEVGALVAGACVLIATILGGEGHEVTAAGLAVAAVGAGIIAGLLRR